MQEECCVCYTTTNGKIKCTFECGHDMCLDCLLQFSESESGNFCHICRVSVDYLRMRVDGGNTHVFLRRPDGTVATLRIDPLTITSSQFRILAELKVNGYDSNNLRLIYYGRNIKNSGGIFGLENPKINDCSTIMCLHHLRGD